MVFAIRHGQEVEALFIANPFAARRFLAPLLAFGAAVSTILTVLDVHLCGLSWSCAAEGWVCAQVLLQIVQSPVRYLLLRSLSDVEGSLDEATASLRGLTQSPMWQVNKGLGMVSAVWCAVGMGVLASSAGECVTGRRLLLLHVGTFTLRCIVTTVHFGKTFHAWEPHGSHQAEMRLSEAKQLVKELPTVRYSAGGELGAESDLRFRQTSCVICLHEYEEGETLCVLGCGHAWHGECLERWLSHRRTCPLCMRWDARLPRDQPAALRAPTDAPEDAHGEHPPRARRRHHALPAGGEDE